MPSILNSWPTFKIWQTSGNFQIKQVELFSSINNPLFRILELHLNYTSWQFYVSLSPLVEVWSWDSFSSPVGVYWCLWNLQNIQFINCSLHDVATDSAVYNVKWIHCLSKLFDNDIRFPRRLHDSANKQGVCYIVIFGSSIMIIVILFD